LLSRWSGGLVEKYGAKLPLIIGPLIAAGGFALFLRPGIGGLYWTTFFPAVVVLGLGMAVSVAPLTTTVMNSVPESRVGVASGINNAVSRTAGLLAIAIFGIVMLQSFNRLLDRRLAQVSLPPATSAALAQQRRMLAGAELPQELDAGSRQLARHAIEQSFLGGFRAVMALGAILAFGSALTAWIMIPPAKGAASPPNEK
jgi:MFS family permease